MRALNFATPHFTDRVDSARQLVASRVRTPELADADRDLLGDTLQRLRQLIGDRGGEQLLHGEPHSGNVLATRDGLLFIDFETCCRGPVEFDLAHAPVEVGEHYPGLDQALLRECRILVLAMVTTWRWDQGDQLPNGRQLAREWLRQIRAAIGRDSEHPRTFAARPAGTVTGRSPPEAALSVVATAPVDTQSPGRAAIPSDAKPGAAELLAGSASRPLTIR
jgi:hypothetical protein